MSKWCSHLWEGTKYAVWLVALLSFVGVVLLLFFWLGSSLGGWLGVGVAVLVLLFILAGLTRDF